MLDNLDPDELTLEELQQYARTWKEDGQGFQRGEQVYAVPSKDEVGFYEIYDSRGVLRAVYGQARLSPTLEELQQYARTWKEDGQGFQRGEQVYAVPSKDEVGFYEIYNSRGVWCGVRSEARLA